MYAGHHLASRKNRAENAYVQKMSHPDPHAECHMRPRHFMVPRLGSMLILLVGLAIGSGGAVQAQAIRGTLVDQGRSDLARGPGRRGGTPARDPSERRGDRSSRVGRSTKGTRGDKTDGRPRAFSLRHPQGRPAVGARRQDRNRGVHRLRSEVSAPTLCQPSGRSARQAGLGSAGPRWRHLLRA